MYIYTCTQPKGCRGVVIGKSSLVNCKRLIYSTYDRTVIFSKYPYYLLITIYPGAYCSCSPMCYNICMNTSPVTRIIFMGTPDFAVPTLRLLHEQAATQHWQVVAVVTQPDRPAGRGNKLVASPVKQYAME